MTTKDHTDLRLHPFVDFCGSYVDEDGVERFLGMLPRYPETVMAGEYVRRVWAGVGTDTCPHPDAVWDAFKDAWVESDTAFRNRIEETEARIRGDDIPDLSDQCNVGDLQAPSAARLKAVLERDRNQAQPTHEAKMLVALELLHKLLELPDNVAVTGVSTKMINRVPTMAVHLEGPPHLLEHGSWVKAVYSHKTKFDRF